MIALAFAFEGVSSLLNGKPWTVWIPAVIGAGAFFLIGVKVPWFNAKIHSVDWPVWGKRLTIALYIGLGLSIVTAGIAGYYAWQETKTAWHQLAHDFPTLFGTPATPVTEAKPKDELKDLPVPVQPKSSQAPDEVIVLSKPVILPLGSLEKYRAQSIISESQRYAAEILACVLKEDYEGQCISLNSTYVTEVRDELHNQGIEFAELNASVQKLESKPSVGELKHAATVLRAVADQVLAMSQPSPVPNTPKPVGAQVEEHHHDPLPDKAVFVLPDRVGLTPYGFRYLASTANGVATDIRVCLVDEQKKYSKNKAEAALACNSRFADRVATVVNTLRDAQVNISSLPDSLKRMEAGADFDELQYIADFMGKVGEELGRRQPKEVVP